jgi:hypothetical protein
MTEAFHDLDALRTEARTTGLPVRRTDARLYDLISRVYGAALRIDRDNATASLRARVEGLKSPKPDARRRAYVERQSDVFILASRYVLTGVDNRNSVYRYAAAMRGAADRQIPPDKLPGWLAENGGLRELLKPVSDHGERSRRVLTLDRPVTFRPGDVIHLTLHAQGAGYFVVITGP